MGTRGVLDFILFFYHVGVGVVDANYIVLQRIGALLDHDGRDFTKSLVCVLGSFEYQKTIESIHRMKTKQKSNQLIE